MTKPTDKFDTCPRCGSALKAEVLGGRCMQCMLAMGAETCDETTSPIMPPAARHESELEYTPLDRGRFVAGTLLSGRYRIIGLLGKGGMGEVYKAEDLKLRQLVALKFLPDALSNDGGMLARFHREVRAARQITHANVCRVHDIGETAIGRQSVHFLSMEYIDGEDLAALLRRIGRLPFPKGVELARQLCSGLAAAHDAGMVHRDLKPANIMFDGRGRARITDFGLSGLAEDFRSEEQAGTPAYMAPEQLHGVSATTASDIYALGLVLYEVFTGEHPFKGRNVQDVINRQDSEIPPPSTRIREIDPLVERAILRCLAKQPADRPKSAYEVAAALPGGDPLAAALAVGETPSPEMVAASGENDGLRPLPAWSLLLSIIAVSLAAGWIFNPASGHRAAFEKSPEGLSYIAKAIMNEMGYSMAPADFAYGVRVDETSPDSTLFWYRESPQSLLPVMLRVIGPFYAVTDMQVSEQDPPPLTPGMRAIRLNATDGLLRQFHAIPAADGPKSSIPVNWAFLLKSAGLDHQSLETTVPQSTFQRGDRQVAWMGSWPSDPAPSVRVEAAEQDGMPIYFEVFGPWNLRPEDAGPAEHKALLALRIAVVIFVMVYGVVLAWGNLKKGRSDRQGAFRLSVFAFLSLMLTWFFGATHRFDPGELNSYLHAVAEALYWSAICGVMYLAVEPFVRHRWPHALISWNRLLEGRLGDSLVGRDVLVGVFLAGLVCILRTSTRLWGLVPPEPPEAELLQSMHSMFQTIAFLFARFFDSANISLALFFLFCFFRAVLRSAWLAIPFWLAVVNALAPEFQLSGVAIVSAFGALWLVAVLRFGVTAGMAMWFADRIFRAEIMLPPQGWHAGRYYVLVGAAVALALYAFTRSLRKHSSFSFKLMDQKEA